MFHFTKKRAVIMAVIASLAMGAGAYAYFTAGGTGSGSATTGSSTPWAISDVSTPSGLTPGGPSGSVSYRVTNPSTGNQHFTKVTISVAGTGGTAWNPEGDCSADDFSVNDAPAGSSYDDFENAGNKGPGVGFDNTVTIKMINDPLRNQDDCQGVTVPLYLVAS